MLVDVEARGLINLTLVKNHLDSDLTLVVLYEVVERNRSLETHKASGKVENSGVVLLAKHFRADEAIVKTDPRAARRVYLVGLVILVVLQVRAILIHEVPDDIGHTVLRPSEPILNRGLNVKDGPAVKFGGVHFANLILRAMLATVNGSDDDGIGVQVVAENLTRIGQLEDALTDLWNRTVHFIEEEDTRVIAALVQPVGRAEASHVAIGAGQTHEVALGHLRRASLDDGQTHVRSHLIDKLRLANSVPTAKHQGLVHLEDVGGNGNKGFEIDSHDYSIIGRGLSFLTQVM